MNINELIEILYEYIMEKKIIQAKELIKYMVKNNVCEKLTILEKVRNYSREKLSSIDDIKKFDLNYMILINYKLREVSYIIERYIKFGSLKINQQNYLLLINFKNYGKDFTELKLVVDEILEKFKDDLSFLLINEQIMRSTYEEEFKQLLKSKNPVELFRKFNWDDKNFYFKLSLFRKKYYCKKDQEYADYLEKKYQEYLKLYKFNNNSSSSTNNYFPLEAIKDLFASGCSIYEYCDRHLEYNVSDLVKTIKATCGEKAKSVLQNLQNLESQEFKQKLNNLLFQIINDPEFTILDYYSITKLSINDFKAKVECHNINFCEFITHNSEKNFNYSKKSYSRFNKEQEMKIKRIIHGVEITEEDKINIFNYLESNEVPVNKFTYRACINKLINGTLDFKQKNKYLKGSF